MNIRSRSIVIALSSALVVAAVFFIALRVSAPTGGQELKKLVTGFMDSLPKDTSAEKRDEIRGIMDRFYAKAVSEGVDPEGLSKIESKLRSYVEKGGIPEDELFGFMSDVGNLTRGSWPPAPQQAGADSLRHAK